MFLITEKGNLEVLLDNIAYTVECGPGKRDKRCASHGCNLLSGKALSS